MIHSKHAILIVFMWIVVMDEDKFHLLLVTLSYRPEKEVQGIGLREITHISRRRKSISLSVLFHLV